MGRNRGRTQPSPGAPSGETHPGSGTDGHRRGSEVRSCSPCWSCSLGKDPRNFQGLWISLSGFSLLCFVGTKCSKKIVQRIPHVLQPSGFSVFTWESVGQILPPAMDVPSPVTAPTSGKPADAPSRRRDVENEVEVTSGVRFGGLEDSTRLQFPNTRLLAPSLSLTGEELGIPRARCPRCPRGGSRLKGNPVFPKNAALGTCRAAGAGGGVGSPPPPWRWGALRGGRAPPCVSSRSTHVSGSWWRGEWKSQKSRVFPRGACGLLRSSGPGVWMLFKHGICRFALPRSGPNAAALMDSYVLRLSRTSLPTSVG
ncbi:U7 snRNA-associated Sm-like protein LSm11 isoform X2 [Chroicocephalus ridibundus]|uniref:U7 snRNA-associated Sm-like protein LSm11 isoform X2 n=1 Tax=Chroicocephalus ridibundus TaxID=1192867 RepID=UPI002FDC8C5B